MDHVWKEKLFPIRHWAHEATTKIARDMAQGKVVYPSGACRFRAFDMPFEKVKVVIIGQDPYHGPGQANGLAFSVSKATSIPPSLLNIYKELEDDIHFQRPKHGDLIEWVNEGVLLLNTSLSVEKGHAGSHKTYGWENFTNSVVEILNRDHNNLVFILWGKHAQQKGSKIDKTKHLVIESVHPSPLSADRGFFGSKPFSKCNEYLLSKGKDIINWKIT